MTAHTPFAVSKALAISLGSVLLSSVLVANAHAAPTALGTEPFTLSTKINALPNIMFVLDDSGSMRGDYLPDWAGPYQDTISGVLTVVTPAHRFFNGAYNGVAYNPGTYYRPPVMYTNAGALDTTTYPSMNGQSAATGGDGSATALLPNWRAVKLDGYGIQSTATSNLEGNAFSFTTVAGEYCTSGQLRTCTASATPTGSYTFPAKLRWCTTLAMSLDTTANAGTNCQASNIDTSDAGVTNYTYARMPRPSTATITVTGFASNVTAITVDGVSILSASATGGTSIDLATDITAKINACTYAIAGTCTAVGYSAVSLSNVVTVTAPTGTTSTPVITGGTTTPSAFSNGSVPGSSLFTVITPTVNSYPYPGTASKGSNRSDCAGSTCSYVEEMTNYANWYAYYRTRMQMMKTSSSIAFSSVTDKFRVGYYSINDGAGGQFLNVAAFDGAQKNLWYSKFFSAVPYGATPLRTGLANIGRVYAGKVSTLNLETVNDPMQYSCQQNFTILSTDGYWNDAANPTQIDGTTEIGEQDGNDPRPYYDGATQTRTVSQTNKTEEQVGINTFLVESRTQQQQISNSRLTQTVVTTDIYPWTTQTTRLQTRTTPLNKTDYGLVQSTYPLTSTTKQLQESTYTLNSTPRILQSYINNLTQTVTPLQDKQFNITSVTTPLQDKQFNITSVTTPLESRTYMLQSSTRQLQQRNQYSTDGGDTWPSTGWVDVSSCTVQALGPGWIKNTECRYNTAVVASGLGTCTTVAASGSSPYTVEQAVSCAYETTPVVATVTSPATCTTRAQDGTSPYQPSVSCGYTGTPVTLTNETACTAVAASGSSPYSGPMRTCTHNATAASTTEVVSPATCTAVTPANAATPKHTCTYTGTPVTLTNETSCIKVDASTGNPYSGPSRTCTHNATAASTTNVVSPATCTAVTPANAATPKHTCGYTGTPVVSTVATCTPISGSPGPINYTVPNIVTCNYASAVLTGTNLLTCTAGTPSGSAPYLAYTTCGYINGTTTTGLNSCTRIADSAGPVNYTGPANACAYTGTASVANVGSCTPVAQDLVNFSAPQKTCAYEAVGTSATNLASCTNVPQSGSAPYAGPNVSCAYSGTATVTNPGSCTVNVEAGSPYTAGAKVSCAYASGVASNNVAACTTQAKQTLTADGTVWNPATDCAYGSTTGWANATVACVPAAQTGASPYAGPARECQYTSPSVDTFTATCTAAAQNNTNLTAINCVGGAFPVTVSTVPTTVDSCNTDPTTDGGVPVERTTATTCVYQAYSAPTDVATCAVVPQSGGSPYVKGVNCPVSDTGYVAVAPSCTVAGTPPLGFDATGKVVECRKTDQIGTTTTTDYANFTPAVSPPVATCTPGTDAGTKVQTKCTTLLSTGPTAVNPLTCTTANPGLAPDYVKTICTTTNVNTTVMGCLPQAADISNQWQTISCVYNAGTGTYNTLADVAAYYYKTDLRTVALNNCTGSIVPPATVPNDLCSVAAELNNVPITVKDDNPKQHMTTFTLGLGASGYMKYSSTYETDSSGDFSSVKGIAPYAAANAITANPGTGVCSWQSTGDCNWPVPVSDEQTAIDDLWHAGVNGHGAYFSATDPVSLANSIAATLAQVAAAGGAAASPSISNPSLTPGDSYVFSSTYTSSDWTGELIRRQLDPGSAQISTYNDWSVQGKLDSNTARNIYTFDSTVATTKLKPFTSANFAANAYFLAPHISTSPTGLTQYLCASTDTCLSATNQDASHAAGANLVNFLRGDRTHEGAETDNTKYYRQRLHVLGDMVNAQVVYVNKPIFSYTDRGYAEESTGFVATNASRPSIVYAGANDGMLHAFHAKGNATTEALVNVSVAATAAAVADPSSTDKATAAAAAAAAANAAVAADTIIGQELWAYIPTMVMPNLYVLADKRYKDKHRYYVDATPVVGDICISDCTTGSDPAVWKTILVGGLGRGGRGYYALDITDPANPKALWEFTDTNLGYSYGNPQITKLSNGTWVVLVTSGYNNIANDDGAGGDGQGRLYVINAATGALIQSIATGFGDTTSPSGLAKITARVKDPTYDNTVEAVYGGDLYGNLWRFDVNKTVGEAQLLAVLKDGSSNLQPITTKPEVAMVPKANAIVVYIGTGRFLAADDANDVSQQTIYAIKDPVVDVATATPALTLSTAIYNNPRALASFVEQIQTEVDCPADTASFICTPTTKVRTSTSNTVQFASDAGWYVDLVGTAERANTDLKIALGGLYFNTNAPTLAACDVGGKSYQYFLDYKTGGAILSPGTNGVVGKFLANELASTITLVMAGDGTMRSISGLSGGGIDVGQPPLPPEAWVTRRTSWRELIRE